MPEPLYERVGRQCAIARPLARQLIHEGRVTVDGIVCTAAEMNVFSNDQVAVTLPKTPKYPTNGRFPQPGYIDGFTDAVVLDAAVDVLGALFSGAIEGAAKTASSAFEGAGGLFGGAGSSSGWDLDIDLDL